MITRLYNGEISLDFDEANHQYTIDGKAIDGVTTILKIINKDDLNDWKIRVGMDYLKEELLASKELTERNLLDLIKKAKTRGDFIGNLAAQNGTKIHQWIEDFISNKNPEFPEDTTIHAKLQSFLRFIEENDPEFTEIERVVYSKKYKYCGTLDFIARIKGKLLLGDFKSSNRIYKTYDFQTSAYQKAYEEETGIKLDGRMIVRLDKSGHPEITITEDQKKDFNAFKSCLLIKRRLK